MFRQATEAANNSSPAEDVYTSDEPDYPACDADIQTRRKKIMIISLSVAALVLVAAIGLGTWFYLDYTEDDGLIYDNVYACGIDLGGMTPEEAAAALSRLEQEVYAKQNLTVKLPDSTLLLTPSSTDVDLDVERLVEDAFNYGRSGSRWERTQAKFAAATTSFEMAVTDYLSIDTTYIRQVVEQMAAAAESELTQTQITIEGKLPELNRTFEEASADESVEHMVMKITLGTPYRHLDADELVDRILEAYASGTYDTLEAEYEVTEPDEVDLDKLFEEHFVLPADAILDEQTYDITPEVLGYGFDQEKLAEHLSTLNPGDSTEYTCAFLPAAVSKASLEANLFQDVLAQVDTDHVYNPNRTTNLTLAAKAIDGYIIRPGEVFSFNQIVGERTAEKGYKPAAIYVGEATEDGTGGGICQVASTIYYAALLADLEIVERTEHMYLVDYVPPGMDATIYWGSLDFKFRNNTDYPIRVDASVSGGQVHVTLVGTNTHPDYYIVMKYETISGPHYGQDKYKVFTEEQARARGYYDGYVIQTAYAGRTIKTYRCRYDSNTKEQIDSKVEATSTFAKRDRITCIIGDPNAPKDSNGKPIETTTEPTTKPTTAPTTEPTTEPTTAPTTEPTTAPTTEPTTAPTEAPTEATEAPQTNEGNGEE